MSTTSATSAFTATMPLSCPFPRRRAKRWRYSCRVRFVLMVSCGVKIWEVDTVLLVARKDNTKQHVMVKGGYIKSSSLCLECSLDTRGSNIYFVICMYIFYPHKRVVHIRLSVWGSFCFQGYTQKALLHVYALSFWG